MNNDFVKFVASEVYLADDSLIKNGAHRVYKVRPVLAMP